MKKIIAILLCFVTLGAFCVTGYAATTNVTETVEFQLEIDVEKRYTDISEMDDYHKTFLDVEDEAEDKKETNKMLYIVILCVLLVIAIIILVVSLKRVPPEESDEKTDDSEGNEASSDTDTSIKAEEKTED